VHYSRKQLEFSQEVSQFSVEKGHITAWLAMKLTLFFHTVFIMIKITTSFSLRAYVSSSFALRAYNDGNERRSWGGNDREGGGQGQSGGVGRERSGGGGPQGRSTYTRSDGGATYNRGYQGNSYNRDSRNDDHNRDEENREPPCGYFEGDHLYGISPIRLAIASGRRNITELIIQEGMEISNKKDEKSATEILKIAKEKGITIREFPKHDLNMLTENRYENDNVYIYIYIYIYI
jgi:hypothetical protein